MTTVTIVVLSCLLALGFGWLISRRLGFLAQRPSDYADQGTRFDIREQLDGDLICEGVIYGPFGRVNTRFVAHMHAEWVGDIGHMSEDFQYDNGGSLKRQWHLKMVGSSGRFEATAPDIIGTGTGQQSGSAVCLKYNIKLPDSAGGYVLNTVDWLYLMENGTIINRSQMRKFGIKVGELVATMRKVD